MPKIHDLSISEHSLKQIQLSYFYLSELFQKIHFVLGDPVERNIHEGLFINYIRQKGEEGFRNPQNYIMLLSKFLTKGERGGQKVQKTALRNQ